MRDEPSDGAQPLRSGDFSRDPRFDPDSPFVPISGAETEDQVIDAMRRYVDAGERQIPFSEAIAVYVREARSRGESVERVLAVLTRLGDRVQDSRNGFSEYEPNRFRELILHGVLLAFFGSNPASPDHPARRRDD